MRYFAELVNFNTIMPFSFLGMIDTFLGAIHEHDVKLERSDHFVYCVLSILPWVIILYINNNNNYNNNNSNYVYDEIQNFIQ